jgi:hypothetical protein
MAMIFGWSASSTSCCDAGFGRVFVVGVHADRGVDVRDIARPARAPGKVRQVDRDAQRVRDLVLGHLGQDLGHARGELGEIDVAVGIDVHPGIVQDGRAGGVTRRARQRRSPRGRPSDHYATRLPRMIRSRSTPSRFATREIAPRSRSRTCGTAPGSARCARR